MARSVRKLADTDLQQTEVLGKNSRRRKIDTLVPEKSVPGSAESRQV